MQDGRFYDDEKNVLYKEFPKLIRKIEIPKPKEFTEEE